MPATVDRPIISVLVLNVVGVLNGLYYFVTQSEVERGRGAGRDAGNLILELNFAHTYRSRAVQLEPEGTPRCGTGCLTLPFFCKHYACFCHSGDRACDMHVFCVS